MYDKIQADIKSAMRNNNTIQRDCLRMIISEIKNQTVNAGKEITNNICLNVIRKAVKQRNDSVEQFLAGGREDLAKKESIEIAYLTEYLPKMYSETDQDLIVLEIINENNIELIKSNTGKIMKLLSSREDINSIDRKYVSEFLKGVLK